MNVPFEMPPEPEPATTRYWKISAGRGAADWPLFRDESIIALSWYDELFDPTELPLNEDAFSRKLQNAVAVSGPGARSIWQFRSAITVGDEVLVYSNRSVIAQGVVTGGYKFDADATDYRHRRTVAWKTVEPISTQDIDTRLQSKLSLQQTLTELTRAEFLEATGQSSRTGAAPIAIENLGGILAGGFASAGLSYRPDQIASFYTALQTKGFVILSGISGTGKSKIALEFSKMLPDILADVESPLAEDYVRIAVRPYMKKYKRIRLWNEVSEGLPVPANGKSVMVQFSIDGHDGKCRVWNRPETNAGTYIFPQGDLGEEFKNLTADVFALRFRIDEEENQITSIEMLTELPTQTGAVGYTGSRISNRKFLSVRPDWRDGKALIGYHNPLSGEYQRTQFLDFVIAAGDDYTAGNRNAFFVILDEMNLAHVEYYFADVLSVIESGRDKDGWTVEGISLSIGEADADLLETLKLPPNLYIVGTVNMDETTHPFSPKVLDRAFTIELTEVDFIGYPPEKSEASESGDDDRQALLRTFTQNGRYPRIDKGDIREVVDRPERFGVDLQSLNLSLRRSRMHFGYRVFDEIMQFVFNAEANGLFTADDAFDHAVLMKVLPKFNGSRAKLQTALFELLHWCHKAGTMSSDDRTDLEARFAKLTDDHTSFDAVVPKDSEAVEDQWRYPATGRRAALMMQDLYTDGFAAFG